MSTETAHSIGNFEVIVRDISDRATAAARNAGQWSAESNKMTFGQKVGVVALAVLTSLMLVTWMSLALSSMIH